ncbi:uncharacterized protein LOC115084732 [Rhinatrema bivittatum]|uniref:uncharacterized protein LOC115084732 n=1 Tax=Rhinatrema bivittatum TaxID=194408 RepID=UPI00112ACE1E|nr:uncharacterized protein LOC115084732 [Rhinatrema bivittatum]XP_029445837.1 uncharacterized protein LOC115084732 [Rhinatrema bivittatum]XP_029445838.1 uncharacterized protein LOC115084732 [Rhinatrema bivittatum]
MCGVGSHGMGEDEQFGGPSAMMEEDQEVGFLRENLPISVPASLVTQGQGVQSGGAIGAPFYEAKCSFPEEEAGFIVRPRSWINMRGGIVASGSKGVGGEDSMQCRYAGSSSGVSVFPAEVEGDDYPSTSWQEAWRDRADDVADGQKVAGRWRSKAWDPEEPGTYVRSGATEPVWVIENRSVPGSWVTRLCIGRSIWRKGHHTIKNAAYKEKREGEGRYVDTPKASLAANKDSGVLHCSE